MQIQTLIDSLNLHKNKENNIVGICTQKKCIITKLDISMQKGNSIYLCTSGLKYYHDNHRRIYISLKTEYLKTTKNNLDLDLQFYYMAHNIRNRQTNSHHNRKKFEKRHYPKEQLQIPFMIN